jgi:hypothetical protein
MKLAPLSLIVTIAYLVQGTPLPVVSTVLSSSICSLTMHNFQAKDVKLDPDVVGYANGPDSYWVRDVEVRTPFILPRCCSFT